MTYLTPKIKIFHRLKKLIFLKFSVFCLCPHKNFSILPNFFFQTVAQVLGNLKIRPKKLFDAIFMPQFSLKVGLFSTLTITDHDFKGVCDKFVVSCGCLCTLMKEDIFAVPMIPYSTKFHFVVTEDGGRQWNFSTRNSAVEVRGLAGCNSATRAARKF